MFLFLIRNASVVASDIWEAAEIAKYNGYDVAGICLAERDDLNWYEDVATIGGGNVTHFFEWSGSKYRYHFTRRSGCTEYRRDPFIIPD